MPTLDHLRWSNSFARLPEQFYHRVRPTALPDPHLVAWNEELAAEIGIVGDPARDPDLLAVLAGNRVTPEMAPVAAIYAGHQFGVWVPQLGDGRAILLGEVVTPDHSRWEIQLKGAGMTRYSRMADGRAVLRSTIREYLASEAMHGLGIPTTRALAVVGSDLPVYRETTETAAVLTRAAPTHVRFGSFELFASRQMSVELERLADHVIEHHFPALLTLPADQRYAAWYQEVVTRTARLMAEWIAVGFQHGVMNTDNFSITGLSIDYGPYGWMERYDPAWICNHSDHAGSYAFGRQPMVGLWNCTRLGEALHPLVSEPDAIAALESFRGTFDSTVGDRLRTKLGLATTLPDDVTLITDWLALLQQTGADYTRSFRALSHWLPGNPGALDALGAEVSDHVALDDWLARWQQRLAMEESEHDRRRAAMLAVNPKYVLRNWIAQDAIDNASTGNFGRVDELRRLFGAPYDEHPAMERYAEPGQEEIVVSCSS
ncbi:MAG: YdiU family protein [Gemmatimonadales bacterium]|nr:YdiU family protein [Gemmatimonadales bacterium]MDZ4390870.1 YdiU family protein [Gemmatimonadales bacterium]